MSYQRERDEFIVRMTREGLDYDTQLMLLRAATTLQRYAELSCSSEAADRDRVPCPAATQTVRQYGSAAKPPMRTVVSPRKPIGPCLCDRPDDGHETIPRIALQEWRLVQRLRKAMPADWAINTQGDPRGYVLRVIPPSYGERNTGKDRYNLDTIGVPSGPSRLRF